MKLSIIIPVYNAAKSIIRTLTSIHQQTNYSFDYEVILVNDGSTDESAQVIEEWAQKHTNCKVFHNTNQGVYITRNFALEQVEGDWIWMIDSDDYILPNSFEKIDKALHNTDIQVISFGHMEETADKNALQRLPNYEGVYNGLEYLEKNDGRLYLWTHIYKRDYLNNKKIRFAGKSFSLEDFLFNINVMATNPKVLVINEALYFYEFNGNSISKKNTLANRFRQLESSKNLHYQIATIRDSFGKTTSAYQILDKKLAHSIVGLFFSLIKEQYPADYTKSVQVDYTAKKLLPIQISYGDWKKDLFVKFINNKMPILLINKLLNTVKPAGVPK